MRSIWSGTVSFGMVVIPVKLYAATGERDVAFHQVHQADGARIHLRRICSADGAEVPYSDLAKGYELPDGTVAVLTDADLARLPLPTRKQVEVLSFTAAGQVSPLLSGKSYYLEPGRGGTRAYVLFREALRSSGRVAVAKVALRLRESLAVIRVLGDMLVLETLLWPDEVRSPDFAFLDEDTQVRSQELASAAMLIDTLTEDFSPDAYHDGYREALEQVIEAKIAGGDVVLPPGTSAAEPGTGAPADLGDILKASVAAAKAAKAAKAA